MITSTTTTHAGMVLEACKLYDHGFVPGQMSRARNTWVEIEGAYYPAKWIRATALALSVGTPAAALEETVKVIRRKINGGQQTEEWFQALGFGVFYRGVDFPADPQRTASSMYVEMEAAPAAPAAAQETKRPEAPASRWEAAAGGALLLKK